MAELPRWVLTHAKKLNKLGLIRVDLRRSWHMHSWLALTFTVAGAVLAALYLVTSWTDPATSAQVAILVFNAAVILLSAIVLGITAAVIVQSIDQKVYSGEDIGYMLGVEPMVELPDLAQLSGEETRELLLPLAGGIIHACPDGALRRCIFTGTGPGAGVSAVAARTKETLEAIGRSVVLVDAAGATPEIGGDNAKDEGVARRDSLILTDTAPLVSSADTEYLVRFADCVIVIAESGVTSREQLRNTVRCLQRLNVAAVGFVLNRVKEVRAGGERRRFSTVPRISSEQFSAAIQRALAHAPHSTQARAKPTLRPQSAASLTQAKEAQKPAIMAASGKRAPELIVWRQPGIPQWMSEALAELEASQPGQGGGQSPNGPAKRDQAEVATSQQADKPIEAGLPRRVFAPNGFAPNGSAAPAKQAGAGPSSNSSENPRDGGGIAPEAGQAGPAAGEVSGKSPSRLSGLRGIVSAAHLRELRQAKRLEVVVSESASQSGSTGQGQDQDVLPSGMPPTLADAVDSSSRGNGTRVGDLRGLVAPEDLKDLNLAKGPLSAGDEAPEQVSKEQVRKSMPTVDEQGSNSSRTGQVSDVGAGTAAASAGAPSKPTVASERDLRAKNEDIQVLPSWRGQYRKK
jgi:hypothetical protein